eukprot:4518531-Lingulodinium_polyedra.AAC.1
MAVAVPQSVTGACCFPDPSSQGTVFMCLATGQLKVLPGQWSLEWEEGWCYALPDNPEVEPKWWKELGPEIKPLYKNSNEKLFWLEDG